MTQFPHRHHQWFNWEPEQHLPPSSFGFCHSSFSQRAELNLEARLMETQPETFIYYLSCFLSSFNSCCIPKTLKISSPPAPIERFDVPRAMWKNHQLWKLQGTPPVRMQGWNFPNQTTHMLTDGKTYVCACATHKEVRKGVPQGRKRFPNVWYQKPHEQVRIKRSQPEICPM